MLSTSKATPPVFRSKLLCLSLLYLFSALLAVVSFTFSTTKCIFRSSPFDPLQDTLFSYPPSYGETKHAIPTSRSSCDSSVFFSDYWVAVKDIQRLCENSTDLGASSLRYVKPQGKADSFGGNLSLQTRLQYLDNLDVEGEIPCGFFQQFPIAASDRIAMEKCGGVVVASAVLGDYDKIRQPRGLGTKTLDLVCFFMFVDEATLTRLDSYHLTTTASTHSGRKIGVWRIVQVAASLYDGNLAMTGVIPKYLIHRLFPNTKYSIWIDGKLQLVVDPLLLIHALVVKEEVDMAISRHPFFLHTMEEAMATARWKKLSDVEALRTQMETYCDNGLQPWDSTKPFPTDVPDSALILRKHSVATNALSCLVFNELESFNHRDQLPFAFVRDKMSPRIKINMFEVQVFEQIVMEYRHNLKRGGSGEGPKLTMAASPADLLGKCHGYLSKMWGEESHE